MRPPLDLFEKELLQDLEGEIDDLLDRFSAPQEKHQEENYKFYDEIDLLELESRSKKYVRASEN